MATRALAGRMTRTLEEDRRPFAAWVADAQRSSEGLGRARRDVVEIGRDWWNGQGHRRQAPIDACNQGLAHRQWRGLESQARQSNGAVH